MEKVSQAAKRSTMVFADRARLACVISERYVEMALPDSKFAIVASQALGFAVTPSNVMGVRKSLGIPNNEAVRREAVAQARAAKKAVVAEVLGKEDVKALVAQVGALRASLDAAVVRIGRLERAVSQPALFGPVGDGRAAGQSAEVRQ